MRSTRHLGGIPALASVMPLWSDSQLAFIHAAGSPDPTRSHFDAQLYLENATPGERTTRDGWMNRLLSHSPVRAAQPRRLASARPVPQILAGRAPVATLAPRLRRTKPLPMDQPEVAGAFDGSMRQ